MVPGTNKEDERLLNKRIQALTAEAEARFRAPVSAPIPARRQNIVTMPSRVSVKSNEIEAPRTMGDVFRYNREMKAKTSADNLADKKANTGIAAFNAQQQAQHYNRADTNAARATDITGEHYNRSDTTAETSAAALIKNNEGKLALDKDDSASLAALRKVQGATYQEQALTSAQNREDTANKNQYEAKARAALESAASNPKYTPIEKAQVLKGQVPGMKDYEAAKLVLEKDANYIKWRALNPRGDEQTAIKTYMEMLNMMRSAQGLGGTGVNGVTATPESSGQDYLDSLLGS